MSPTAPESWPTPSPIDVHRLPHHVWNRRQQLGTAVRLVKGLYVVTSEWEDLAPWQRHRVLVEAWHAWNPRFIFCGATSIALRGLPVLHDPWEVQICAASQPASRSQHRVVVGGRAIATHTVLRLPPLSAEPPFEQHGNWRVAELAGTAAAYAGAVHTPLGEAVVVLDGAWRALGGGVAARSLLESVIGRLPRAADGRRAAAALEAGSPKAESAAESLARLAIQELGFAAPVDQLEVVLEGLTFRPDFTWPRPKLILEVDGNQKYSGADEAAVRRDEKARQLVLERAGFRVARAEWSDVRDPAKLRNILVHLGVPPR